MVDRSRVRSSLEIRIFFQYHPKEVDLQIWVEVELRFEDSVVEDFVQRIVLLRTQRCDGLGSRTMALRNDAS